MFKDLGAPVKEGAILGQSYVVGQDGEGNQNCIYISLTQYENSVLLLKYNTDTNETTQYRAENNPNISAKQGAWGIASVGSRVYLGTYYQGHLLRYDAHKDEMIDLGQAVPGEEYIWSLAYDGKDKLYGGTFPGGKLFALDLNTEMVTDLGTFDKESMYCRNVRVRNDGKVVAALGSKQMKLGIYDPESNGMSVIPYPEAITGFPEMTQDAQGNIFVKAPKSEDLYQVVGNGLIRVEQRGAAPELQLSGGRKVVSVTNTHVTLADQEGNQAAYPLQYESGGLMMWMVHKGPDAKIYGSSALPLRMFRYDPATGESVKLGCPTPSSGGEIYSMTNVDGKLYSASYPGSYIAVYDPMKPWNVGREAGHNPREIGQIGSRQNRPVSMITGPDGNIYIASVPDYGEVSGALTRLNLRTEQFTVWRGIVDEQSVYVLDNIPGTRLICAGTTNEVGTGADRPTLDARLFIWDIDKEQKVKEIHPVAGAEQIVSIKHKDGMIYGLTGHGVLFAYDYEENRVAWQKEIPIQKAIWPGMDITERDIIYGAGDNKLFRYDIRNDQFSVVAEAEGWLLGFHMDKENNKIYCTPGARLYCYDIEDE